MIKKLCTVLFAGALSAGLLTACHPRPLPQTGISVEQKHCAANCLTLETSCNRQYRKLYEQCVAHAKFVAKQRYSQYVEARHKAHKRIRRTERDFLDLRPCTQQLHCSGDYQVCYSRCGI